MDCDNLHEVVQVFIDKEFCHPATQFQTVNDIVKQTVAIGMQPEVHDVREDQLSLQYMSAEFLNASLDEAVQNPAFAKEVKVLLEETNSVLQLASQDAEVVDSE